MNIKITKILPEMAETIYSILLENKQHINEFLPHIINNTKSVKDELNFIKSRNKDFDDTFVILYNEKIVGMIDIHNINLKESSAEIGYWISLKYQGKGIVSKALKLLINYCKDVIKLKTLLVMVKTKNTRSHYVLLANDFVKFKSDENESWYKREVIG